MSVLTDGNVTGGSAGSLSVALLSGTYGPGSGHSMSRDAAILTLLLVCPVTVSAQVCDIELDAVAELGQIQDPTSVIEPYRVHVARTADGGYAVTGAGRQVVTYRADGSFEGYPIPEGEGPGELRAAIHVAQDPYDSLWVSGPGRLVILDPDDSPARTLTEPSIRPVDGFTPNGLPYSVYVRPGTEHTMEEPALFASARIYSRDGEDLWTVGPGAVPSAQGVPPVELVPRRSVVALSDSVFLGWSSNDGQTWVSRWTQDGAEAALPGAEVWQALDLGESAPRFDQGSVVDVSVGSDGAVWVLGHVRRQSRQEETAMREQIAERMGGSEYPGSPDITFRPQIMNHVQDGALLRLASAEDASVTGAVLFEEYPWGFVDSDHFFTMVEEETGLIKIRVWSFAPRCN